MIKSTKKRFAASLVTLGFLASCATIPTGQPTSPEVTEEVVTIYRALRLNAAGTAIDWTKNSFGVSGAPVPTLSFFGNKDGMPLAPCWLEIDVTMPDGYGAEDSGTLTIPNPPPAGVNPGPWTVTFDDNPPGHWSITKATIGGASNTAASKNAALVFTAMATAGTATVSNGANTAGLCVAPD